MLNKVISMYMEPRITKIYGESDLGELTNLLKENQGKAGIIALQGGLMSGKTALMENLSILTHDISITVRGKSFSDSNKACLIEKIQNNPNKALKIIFIDDSNYLDQNCLKDIVKVALANSVLVVIAGNDKIHFQPNSAFHKEYKLVSNGSNLLNSSYTKSGLSSELPQGKLIKNSEIVDAGNYVIEVPKENWLGSLEQNQAIADAFKQNWGESLCRNVCLPGFGVLAAHDQESIKNIIKNADDNVKSVLSTIFRDVASKSLSFKSDISTAKIVSALNGNLEDKYIIKILGAFHRSLNPENHNFFIMEKLLNVGRIAVLRKKENNTISGFIMINYKNIETKSGLIQPTIYISGIGYDDNVSIRAKYEFYNILKKMIQDCVLEIPKLHLAKGEETKINLTPLVLCTTQVPAVMKMFTENFELVAPSNIESYEDIVQDCKEEGHFEIPEEITTNSQLYPTMLITDGAVGKSRTAHTDMDMAWKTEHALPEGKKFVLVGYADAKKASWLPTIKVVDGDLLIKRGITREVRK